MVIFDFNSSDVLTNNTTMDGIPTGSTSPTSSFVPLLLISLILAVITLLIIFSYGKYSHSWYVQIVVFVGWFFPFWIVILLPLDLASTLYNSHCPPANDTSDVSNHFTFAQNTTLISNSSCDIPSDSACSYYAHSCSPPFGYISPAFLTYAWRAVYWAAFVLTWALIPFLQSYLDSGAFTVRGRLASALRRNLIYYAISFISSVIALGVLLFNFKELHTREALTAFVIAAANCWGLLLVILFMGHGLVEVPRRLWTRANVHRELRVLYARTPRIKEALIDSEVEISELARELALMSKKLVHRPNSEELHTLVQQMMDNFPEAKEANLGREGSGFGGPVPADLSEKSLTALNRRIKRAQVAKARAVAIWYNLLREAWYLQDIIRNEYKEDKKFISTLYQFPQGRYFHNQRLTLAWYYNIKFRPIILRTTCLLMTVLSLVVLWSEVTFNRKDPVLSIVGIVLRACGYNYMVAELFSFVIIAYMCICAYTSLLKLKVFDYYVVIPGHHTDASSLLFVAAYLCRLMAPLCYNYLNLAAEEEDTINTVFYTFMGKLDFVPLFRAYTDYVPVLILLPTSLVFLNIHTRLSSWLNVQNYFKDDGKEGSGGEVAEGRAIIEEERLIEERKWLPSNGNERPSGTLGGIPNRVRTTDTLASRKPNNPTRPGGPRRTDSTLDVESSSNDPTTVALRDELLASRTNPRRKGASRDPTAAPYRTSPNASRASSKVRSMPEAIGSSIRSKLGPGKGSIALDSSDEDGEGGFFRFAKGATSKIGEIWTNATHGDPSRDENQVDVESEPISGRRGSNQALQGETSLMSEDELNEIRVTAPPVLEGDQRGRSDFTTNNSGGDGTNRFSAPSTTSRVSPFARFESPTRGKQQRTLGAPNDPHRALSPPRNGTLSPTRAFSPPRALSPHRTASPSRAKSPSRPQQGSGRVFGKSPPSSIGSGGPVNIGTGRKGKAMSP